MNIFVLDQDPKLAAKYHCDKHVVKMTTETLQMLASVHWSSHGIFSKKQITPQALSIWGNFPRTENGVVKPYGVGFMHHPCTKWIKESSQNWSWAVSLCDELIHQHITRWKNVPSTKETLEWFVRNPPNLPNVPRTPFAQAMPMSLKSEDAVHSYRLYYAAFKEYFAKWKTEFPPWWETYLQLSENVEVHPKVKLLRETTI